MLTAITAASFLLYSLFLSIAYHYITRTDLQASSDTLGTAHSSTTTAIKDPPTIPAPSHACLRLLLVSSLPWTLMAVPTTSEAARIQLNYLC